MNVLGLLLGLKISTLHVEVTAIIDGLNYVTNSYSSQTGSTVRTNVYWSQKALLVHNIKLYGGAAISKRRTACCKSTR